MCRTVGCHSGLAQAKLLRIFQQFKWAPFTPWVSLFDVEGRVKTQGQDLGFTAVLRVGPSGMARAVWLLKPRHASLHPHRSRLLLSAGDAEAGYGAWEGRTARFPQAMAESQAAIWLSLAQGSRGLCGMGPVAGWGQGHRGQAVCLCVMTQDP